MRCIVCEKRFFSATELPKKFVCEECFSLERRKDSEENVVGE